MNQSPYDNLDETEDPIPSQRIVKQEVEDLKWLMSNKRGRRIVYRLLGDAGVFRISFSTDALMMAFNEGNRNNGLKILNTLVQYCPARYAEMLEEANNV